ncbi:hypothetical protein [Robiginitalea sp.]|uniref:hypothetical protein n=1 Tax=Robiginitalea sp. TaxID=1902411 RepID=UPI003C3E94C6
MKRTGVVTLTYGDRVHLLGPVLDELECLQDIFTVVVVCNGITSEAMKLLKSRAEGSDKIELLDMGFNSGSAKGFKDGMVEVEKHSVDYIWLLDDDNLPASDALHILQEEYTKLAPRYPGKPFCLLSYRPDRSRYRSAVLQGDPQAVIGPYNSFLGFHWKQKLQKALGYELEEQTSDGGIRMGQVLVAPYGGMFFHKELLREIGYPREEFFLYGDDHDFSYRITQAGGAIILLLDSVIHDLEVSFHLDKSASRKRISSRFFKTESRNAIYYSARNSIVFEQNFVNRPFEYLVNKYIYLWALGLAMLWRFRHLWKFPIILKAVKDSKSFNAG